jgi:hypothetical protein
MMEHQCNKFLILRDSEGEPLPFGVEVTCSCGMVFHRVTGTPNPGVPMWAGK